METGWRLHWWPTVCWPGGGRGGREEDRGWREERGGEEELSGDLPHPPPHHPELPRLADIKAQHCQLSGLCLSTDQERLPGLLLS